MRKIKTAFLTGFLTLGVFSMIAYTSCSKKDKCSDIICNNGGTCVDGVCQCPLGFEGTNCDAASADKFSGSFSAADNCPVGTRSGDSLNYTITIFKVNTTTLRIVNLANSSPNNILNGELVGKDSVLINNQTLSDGRTYSGTVVYKSPGNLSVNFQIKANNNIVEACSSNLTK